MSLVVYASTHGEASGVTHDRFFNELVFSNAPAGLSLSYTYDAGLVATNGAFTIPDLTIRVGVPGYFGVTIQTDHLNPGIITVGGGIRFHAAFSVFGPNAYPPNEVIDVTFAGGDFTPGVLPSSLAGLEGVVGSFSAQVNPSVGFREPMGWAIGSAVSAPEPSSALLMGVAMIIALFTGILRSRRLARQR